MDGRAVLVFAHYFGGSGRSWRPLVDALGLERVCETPDLQGFGGTAPPLAGPSLDAYADQLTALADGRPWIVVGHSMGGKAALWLGARRPAGLAGVVLIAASPPTPEPMSEDARRDTLAAFGDREAARRHIAEITDDTLTPDLFAQCVEDEVSVARPAWIWWLETGSRLDISAQTQAIDLPVLVLAGDHDTVMGPKTAPAIAASLVHAELELIPGGGHLVTLEHPAAVARAMHRFLERLV